MIERITELSESAAIAVPNDQPGENFARWSSFAAP
jgi:hypothetical protein